MVLSVWWEYFSIIDVLQLFLDNKINLSDFLATKGSTDGKKSIRVNPKGEYILEWSKNI